MKLAGNAVAGAKDAGADLIVTPCPLCHLNLDSYQPTFASKMGRKLGIPILHVPQLVALALGYSQADLRMQDARGAPDRSPGCDLRKPLAAGERVFVHHLVARRRW